MIGSKRDATESRAGRRTIGRRTDGGDKDLRVEIEDVDVISGGEVEPLAEGIVDDEFVDAGARIEMSGGQILEGFRDGGGSGRGVDGEIRFAGGAGWSLKDEAFERKRKCRIEAKSGAEDGERIDADQCSVLAAYCDGETASTAAKAIAEEGDGVSAGGRTGIREGADDGGAVAEGVGGGGEPAIREIADELDGASAGICR